MSPPHPVLSLTYGERAARYTNPAAKLLLETMERKQSNLCVSVDVTEKEHFLQIIDVVGRYVCLVKTHVDILEDFDDDLIAQLQKLSIKHDFLIFEDRKFADIGNTVSLQYAKGVHKIASWSHITNAHSVAGPSIIAGLAPVGLPLGRGLLLLAEMSTKGSLAAGAYADATVRMARSRRDFVIGFIAQQRMEGVGVGTETPNASPNVSLAASPTTKTKEMCEDEDFLILSPGVGLDAKGDAMGQQYRTPEEVVLDSGCDVIIVGRGIYGKWDSVDVEHTELAAERYRDAGWKAYEERLKRYAVGKA